MNLIKSIICQTLEIICSETAHKSKNVQLLYYMIIIIIIVRNTRKTVKDDLILTIHPGERFKIKNKITCSHEVHIMLRSL